MDFERKPILDIGDTGSFTRKFVGRVLNETGARRFIVDRGDELKQFDMRQQFGDDPRLSGEIRSR